MSKLCTRVCAGALGLALILVLSACGSAPTAPPDRFYRLPMPASATGIERLSEGVVRVRPLKAEGAHAERAILYTPADDPLRLEQERYAFWIDSPPRLVQQYLIARLRTDGVAEMVVDESVQDADFELRGRLLNFERVSGDDRNAFVIGVELRLDHGYGKPVLIREYRETVQVGGDSMSSVAQACAQALDEFAGSFVSEARAVLASGSRN